MGFMRIRWLALLVLILSPLVATRALFAQIETRPFVFGSRPYLIYKPAHAKPHPSVVFMLGGVGSTAQTAAEDFGWQGEADRICFIVVFVERCRGIPINQHRTRTSRSGKTEPFSRMNRQPGGRR
jgi:poly(3-hydroxybutyrate) depolymerase